MNRETRPAPDRRVLVVGGIVLALGLFWLVHAPVLSELIRRAVPWVAGQSGYAASVAGVRATMRPVEL